MSNPESVERPPTENLNTAIEWPESGRQVTLATNLFPENSQTLNRMVIPELIERGGTTR